MLIDPRYMAACNVAAAQTLEALQAQAEAVATAHRVQPPEALRTILNLLGAALEPEKAPELDRRNGRWRARFLIYRGDNLDDVVADSDDGLAPGQPGTWIFAGLATVLETAPKVAAGHATEEGFGRPIAGFEPDTLSRKERGIRPTLSRKGGTGTFRLEYETETPQGHKRKWLMRIDVLRETTETP